MTRDKGDKRGNKDLDNDFDRKVEARYTPLKGAPHFAPETIAQLPKALRAAQETFERTGGLHAAALFNARGRLLVLREDVGRHNALDKLVGSQVLAGAMPLHDRILMVSGRVSFEIVQKAAAAGIPAVASISAPTSLAVDLQQTPRPDLPGCPRQ